MSMIEIVRPSSIIHDARLRLHKDTISMGFSILPVSLIDISIRLSQSPSAIEGIVFGESLVDSPLRELDDSDTFIALK